MNELSLFTGAGGGLLGTHLLGWRPIGYVEFNEYCQRVIRARIDDGILPNAPIFTDVRKFIESGCAEQYRGFADVVTAGFPCQPFSTAGHDRRGADDERNMWPATIECLRLVRPKYALLENVPGLLTSGYFGTVLGDLAAAGYDCKWTILSACSLGAPHPRERLFMLAHARGIGFNGRGECSRGPTALIGNETAQRRPHYPKTKRPLQTAIWRTAESDVCRMVDGLGSKLERAKSVGNGQVPIVAATAWHLLSEGL